MNDMLIPNPKRRPVVKCYLWFHDPMDGKFLYILPGLPAPVPGRVYWKAPVARCWLN